MPPFKKFKPTGALGPRRVPPGLAKKPGQMAPGQYKHMTAGTGPYKPGGPKAAGVPVPPSTAAPVPGAIQARENDIAHSIATTKAEKMGKRYAKPFKLGGAALDKQGRRMDSKRRHGPKAGRGYLRPGFKGRGKRFRAA